MLEDAEPAGAVADLYISRDGSDARVDEWRDQPPERLPLEDRVRVHHHDDRGDDGRQRRVERARFPAVGLTDDPQARVVRPSLRRNRRRRVARPIVDDDGLDTDEVAREDRAHARADDELLVVGRDEDGDLRDRAWPRGPPTRLHRREDHDNREPQEHEQRRQAGKGHHEIGERAPEVVACERRRAREARTERHRPRQQTG